MKNYSLITPEDIQTAINESPKAVQTALSSDELSLATTEISAEYGIDAIEDRGFVFQEMVLLFILGFITPEELPSELDEALEINDTEVSHELAGDVIERVLAVIELIGQNPTTPPTTTIKPIIMDGLPPKQNAAPAPTPIESTQPQTPTFGPGRPVSQSSESTNHYPLKPNHSPDAPFVIHKNEEVKSNVTMDSEARGTTRPVFYKPATPQKPADYAPPSTVRVDMGGGTVNPQAIPKTVNYTAYTPQQATPTNPDQNTKVHPENVVDLKDLPR